MTFLMVRIHFQKQVAMQGHFGQRSEILHGTLYGQYTCDMPYKNTGSIREKKLIFGPLLDPPPLNENAKVSAQAT